MKWPPAGYRSRVNSVQHCIMPVGDHLVEVAVRDVRDGEFVLVQTLSPGFGEATLQGHSQVNAALVEVELARTRPASLPQRVASESLRRSTGGPHRLFVARRRSLAVASQSCRQLRPRLDTATRGRCSPTGAPQPSRIRCRRHR